MKYWTFEPNSCRFERTTRQVALIDVDIAVVNDGVDVYVVRDCETLTRWQSGDLLVVAGALFERELFE